MSTIIARITQKKIKLICHINYLLNTILDLFTYTPASQPALRTAVGNLWGLCIRGVIVNSNSQFLKLQYLLWMKNWTNIMGIFFFAKWTIKMGRREYNISEYLNFQPLVSFIINLIKVPKFWKGTTNSPSYLFFFIISQHKILS